MSKLLIVKAKQLEKILYAIGFKKVRQKGSHVFYKHPDGRKTTIPHHKGKDITRPLLRTILKDIDISVETYNKLQK